MKIVADANLYDIQRAFEGTGELVLVPGRQLDREHLKGAEALLVRSVTQVDAELLKTSNVRFVGTFTSGADHIDNTYLASRDITFVDAKGSNANAVVDYCFAALAYCITKKSLSLKDCKIGIIGGGNVGGLFAEKLRRLNVDVRICDPLLQRAATASSLEKYCSMDAVGQCDVVSLHVPLTMENDYPTYGLIDAAFLATLPHSATLINTCRGSVVDEAALLKLLIKRPDLTCIVDVWENEPIPNSSLVGRVDIATPHIAGYSVEAKRRAITHVLGRFRKEFDLPGQEEPTYEDSKALKITNILKDDPWATVLKLFPLCNFSKKFKMSYAHENRADVFDRFRQNMVTRREFNKMKLPYTNLAETQRSILEALDMEFY